jgi:hypothetical protein
MSEVIPPDPAATETQSQSFSNPSAAHIPGYRPLTVDETRLVKSNKWDEEALLRRLDQLSMTIGIDQRWLSIARTHFEQGYMALNRAIMRPQRLEEL